MLLSTLLVALLSLGLSHADSGEVMGCGGFVQSSKSNIDLSRIQIGFYEKRNNVLRFVYIFYCFWANLYHFYRLEILLVSRPHNKNPENDTQRHLIATFVIYQKLPFKTTNFYVSHAFPQFISDSRAFPAT